MKSNTDSGDYANQVIFWLFIMLLAGFAIIMLVAYGQHTQIAQDMSTQFSDTVVSKIQYFRDDRTNICFAGYTTYGGAVLQSLATVKCEDIPQGLLHENLPQ